MRAPINPHQMSTPRRKIVLLCWPSLRSTLKVNGTCTELAQFAEWREWDRVMEQDRDWNKLIQPRDDTILSFQLGALEDTLSKTRCLHRPSANCGIKPKWMQPVKYAKAVNNALFLMYSRGAKQHSNKAGTSGDTTQFCCRSSR